MRGSLEADPFHLSLFDQDYFKFLKILFLTIFFKVVLPLMFSAFIAGFIYTFMTTMMSLSSVIFLVTPGFDLASVYIYLTAQLGELGLASAATMKVIAIVAISLGILKIVAKKTRLDVGKK